MRLKLVDDMLEVLKVLTDNNIEESALLNVLNAKLANMICLKNCTFRQYDNFKPSTITYYAMNFLNSGQKKDFTIDCINNYFLSFVPLVIQDRIDIIRDEKENELAKIDQKKYPKEYTKLERELDAFRVANFELENPNYSGLYAEAAQIKKINFGGLCIRISELGDYLSEIVGGDASKKRLYNSLKTIFEGKIAPNIIQGDGGRETLYNVPVQAIMYSDFENLFNPKERDYYIKNLKTGMARRCFIYMPKEKDIKKNMPLSPEEKQDVILKANDICGDLYDIFTKIDYDTIYDLSNDAKHILHQYHCKCVDKSNNSREDSILKIELEESFWKITKLAVVYGILDNPTNKIIDSQYVMMAIDFYKSIHEGLKLVLCNKEETIIDKYVKLFKENTNKSFSTTEISNQRFISNVKFSKWWKNEGYETIRCELWDYYKINLVEEKTGKTVYYIAKSPQIDNDNSISCSVTDKKQSNAAQGYEFRTMDLDVFKQCVLNEYNFVAGKLKNGYRKDDNYLGDQKTIWLDIENGMSLKQAQERFRDYWYFIYTTRSHGTKGVGDRFRLILKTTKTLPSDGESYKRIMKHIIEDFGADVACCNPSRHYYGNKNAVFYHNQGMCFDWSEYDYFDNVAMPIDKTKTIIVDSQNLSHGLNDKNLFTDYGDKCLKMNEVYANHRDEGFAVVVGGLIKCVKEGAITHDNAKYWLKNKLNQWMTADFRPNAEKFLSRLERLEF